MCVAVSMSNGKRARLDARHMQRTRTMHSHLPVLQGPYPRTVQRSSNPSYSVQDPIIPDIPRPAEDESPRPHAPCNSNHASALNPIHSPAAMHAAQPDHLLCRHADERSGTTLPAVVKTNLMTHLSCIIIPTCMPYYHVRRLGTKQALHSALHPM